VPWNGIETAMDGKPEEQDSASSQKNKTARQARRTRQRIKPEEQDSASSQNKPKPSCHPPTL